MTDELYDQVETESAFAALTTLVNSLPEPFLLLGGWAVYVTVNQSFSEMRGSNYLGSRDIDVCFHIERAYESKELEECTYAKAVRMIRAIGYLPHSNGRFCKIIKKDTGESLTEERAREYPIYDLYYLYIDIMVDFIHPLHGSIFGCGVIDDPIFERVFTENSGVIVKHHNLDLVVPPPHILLASKLKSIPNRTNDDKKIKDACDIFAVLWHSSAEYLDIVSSVQREYPIETKNGVNAITEEIAKRAARHLGIESEEYHGVINKLNRD